MDKSSIRTMSDLAWVVLMLVRIVLNRTDIEQIKKTKCLSA